MVDIPPLPPGVPKDPPKPAQAPPGLPQAPLVTTEGLKVGDVVQIAVQLIDKLDGRPFWWKRFAVVLRTYPSRSGNDFEAITLKMHPNLDRLDTKCDIRQISLSVDENDRPQVVTKVPEPWPQGIAAMHMKYLAKGWIKLGDE